MHHFHPAKQVSHFNSLVGDSSVNSLAYIIKFKQHDKAIFVEVSTFLAAGKTAGGCMCYVWITIFFLVNRT